jgi:D-glycero-D-manno-heptose 1,7-bisphosphate phosphatase
MTKIIFFDLDGTLREAASGKTFINEPTDQKAIEGTQKALSYYQDKGFILIGITNQGGVVAGHKSLESAIEEQRITLDIFPQLSEIFFCPNWGESCYQLSRGNVPLEFGSPVAGDGIKVSCRKAGHGMLLLAAQSLVDLNDGNHWMIGDRSEDKQCAEAAGVNFVWASIMHAKFASPSPQEIHCQHIQPDVLIEFLSL